MQNANPQHIDAQIVECQSRLFELIAAREQMEKHLTALIGARETWQAIAQAQAQQAQHEKGE
jgi:hypothetical protein